MYFVDHQVFMMTSDVTPPGRCSKAKLPDNKVMIISVIEVEHQQQHDKSDLFLLMLYINHHILLLMLYVNHHILLLMLYVNHHILGVEFIR